MLNEVFWQFVSITEISIFGYFFYVSVYNLVLSFFGVCKVKIKYENDILLRKIAILIPAYQEDRVIVQSVNAALKVDYPEDAFDIVVISDGLHENTIDQLNKLPIIVHQVEFKQSTKVKAIQSALLELNLDSEILIILDADNIIQKDFLKKTTKLYSSGLQLVQGRRIIKNQVNHLALLDDLSEQINNHINRRGATNIGASSSIAGSGFYVDFKLGRKIFLELDSVGGFDKEFEIAALKKGVKTHYSDELIVADEKIDSRQVFEKQRKRWISSQYYFLRRYFYFGLKNLLKGKFLAFNSIILRNFQLPRIINLGLFSALILFLIISNFSYFVPLTAWEIIYVCFLLSIIIAIPRRYYRMNLLISMLHLPMVFLTMFKTLFKLKGANKTFIHTPHKINSTSGNE